MALAVLTVAYLTVWVRSVRRAGGRGPAGEDAPPRARHVLIGFVTNFLDTLGIGSFATTTSLFRLLRAVPDELIPGTLNVGHAPPTVVQAFIYIAIVAVAMPTLAAMIARRRGRRLAGRGRGVAVEPHAHPGRHGLGAAGGGGPHVDDAARGLAARWRGGGPFRSPPGRGRRRSTSSSAP